MLYCDKCGSRIDGNQRFCPNCGNQISNQKNKKSKNNNAANLISALIIIVAVVYVGVKFGLKENDYVDFNKYSELDPQELHTDYTNNEISAKDKYVGNYYYFSGEIYNVEEFLNDKYLEIRYIYTKDKSKIIELDAYFNAADAIKKVKKGDEVTLYCKFKQRSIDNYMNTVTTYSLHSCRIK